MIGDKTFLTLKGLCLFGLNLIDGRSRCRFHPSNQTLSPILNVRSRVFLWLHFFWALIISRGASSLAFFQSLRRSATVGIEDVTSKISALGV